MIHSKDTRNVLNRPLTLPCGATIKNRFVKSAMSDSLGDGEGNPTQQQTRLYERWAQENIGLSIIGEVQVDAQFPEKPGNLVLDEHSNLPALQELAARSSINGAHIWPQLSHAGGLSYAPLSHPKGPSALDVNELQCNGFTEKEISTLPDCYARAALIAQQSGFTGVQIHAGHGFLLSQFLSPLFNRRQDQFGGTVEARSKIVISIIEKVRNAVGAHFPIGIKLNSSDQIEGGLTQEEALEVVSILDHTSVDLIEISGGSYFPGAKSSSDSVSARPYFIDFSRQAKKRTSIPVVVTGGFKNYDQVVEALSSHAAEAIGLGRALALYPSLANDWTEGNESVLTFPRFDSPPPGGITAWYTMLLTAVASDAEQEFSTNLEDAVELYERRDESRIPAWRAKYS
ncbi:NADH:flavin oxidoreductase/NADH oxidase family protein [uncultured Vibrio sp.]|uniref:NADH:flavin oxidoreductase/NADH oxidase family protein n=1 Tax=uncultured Vibrio sp. TaxID=114054 RepID=UPI0025E28407|nr:NADH:flavin oxidoreductase/NADH oxidase family protein [uncultured Vibrio sp.]